MSMTNSQVDSMTTLTLNACKWVALDAKELSLKFKFVFIFIFDTGLSALVHGSLDIKELTLKFKFVLIFIFDISALGPSINVFLVIYRFNVFNYQSMLPNNF